MLVKFWIFGIYILCLTVHRALFQFIQDRLCSALCFCSHSDRLVFCDKLYIIPRNLDEKYNRLVIRNGNFLHPIIYQFNLTRLSRLNTLKVIYSGLRSIEARAFEFMIHLKTLDLSHNKLQVIEPYTFSGLDLNELHLMDNPGIRLLPNSFAVMTVKFMNLGSNNIYSIQYEIFSGADFEVLFLYNNKIKTLEKRFSYFLMKPNSFIDLTNNSLNCSCELKWLLSILQEKRNDNQLNSLPFMKHVNITCEYPLKLKDKELSKLSVKSLSCPKAKITAITVALGLLETVLTCVAEGNNHKVPGVAWNYAESDNFRELRRTSVEKPSNSTENLQASLSVKVKGIDKLQTFNCTSWFEDSQSEDITIKILVQSQYLNKNSVTTINYNNKTESNTKVIFRPVSELHFIFKKQFTNLEMIGAVVGTFVITLILLTMLALYWWKRSHKSETISKSVNIIKPYWVLGHDSNNTHSHPISHIDYGFLTTFETEALSMCQTPPLRRGKYLDYKTQNRIFVT